MDARDVGVAFAFLTQQIVSAMEKNPEAREEALERIANGLTEVVSTMRDTAAGDMLASCVHILIATEPSAR